MTKISPLGIYPRTFWVENRLRELDAAIVRYASAEWPVPKEWIYERLEHIACLNGVYNGTAS